MFSFLLPGLGFGDREGFATKQQGGAAGAVLRFSGAFRLPEAEVAGARVLS